MIRNIVGAAMVALTPVVATASTLGPYTDLVVFGDSLSDPGNVFIATDGAEPNPSAYPNGQFTNGDTWATKLGADLESGTNFAFGGAKAVTDTDRSPDFTAQIAAFRQSNLTLGDNPLAAVWFGGNDLLAALANPATISASINNAVASIVGGVTTLANAGLKDFIVFGLPNLGRLPGAVSAGQEAAGTTVTVGFNNALQAGIGSIETANVRYFDVFDLFETTFNAADELGFTNTTEACLFARSPDFCAGDSGFIFHDGIHPTDAVHDIVADAVQAAVVPLPAGGLLLITGLGALVMVRRRRA